MSVYRIAIPLFLSLAALGVGPSSALADPPEGFGIGPRIEDGVTGIGVDYWTSRLGVSLTLGGSLSNSSSTWILEGADEASDESSEDSYGLQGSAAVFGSLANGERTRLALGLRAGVTRYDGTFADGVGNYSQTFLTLQVPLRLQWYVTDHVSIHTDVGVGVRRTTSTSDAVDYVDGVAEVYGRSESTWWTFEEFASPFGNLGVTYFF